MRILHLIASADAKSGGPIEYARLMATEHAKAGHISAFVTLDSPNTQAVRDFGFPIHAAGPGHGDLGFTPNYGRMIANLAHGFDVAVVHGLWNYATMGGHYALTEAGLPWVIFTHGMLDPYFRREKPIKHWIKQGVWTLWQGRALTSSKAVLFTCEEERLLAQNAFWGHQHYPEKVVAFCAAEMGDGGSRGWADFSALVPKLGRRDYLLYLSRIHPKKACDQLIEAFAQVAPRAPGLDLVMAGPDQTGWRAQLQALARRLGVDGRIHWPGMVKGSAKEAAFRRAQAFVLPSHQENFGLVVAEALSAGVPVLISDKVNIWREVLAARAGLVAPDTTAGTAEMLKQFLDMPAEETAALRAAARPCYTSYFSIEAAAADLEATLLNAVGKRSTS